MYIIGRLFKYLLLKPLALILYFIMKVVEYLGMGILALAFLISHLLKIMVGIYVLGILFGKITDDYRYVTAICGAVIGVLLNTIIKGVLYIVYLIIDFLEDYLFY